MAYPFIRRREIFTDSQVTEAFQQTTSNPSSTLKNSLSEKARMLYPMDLVISELGLFADFTKLCAFATKIADRCNSLGPTKSVRNRFWHAAGNVLYSWRTEADAYGQIDAVTMRLLITDHIYTIVERVARANKPQFVRFVSPITAKRFKNQIAWLEKFAGDKYTSFDERRKRRLAENAAILKGIHSLASSAELELNHYTLVLPSNYHPILAGKEDCCSIDIDKTSVRLGAKLLRNVCTRTRKSLHHKLGIKYWSLAVEPHRDGTPHLHLIVWCRPEHALLYFATLQDELVKVTGSSTGIEHLVHRNLLTDSTVDPGVSMAMYLHGTIDDQGELTSLRAWNNLPELRGLRMYEHCRVGVGLYRELRHHKSDVSSLGEYAMQAQIAARSGDFRSYIEYATMAGLQLNYSNPAPCDENPVGRCTTRDKHSLRIFSTSTSKTIDTIHLVPVITAPVSDGFG